MACDLDLRVVAVSSGKSMSVAVWKILLLVCAVTVCLAPCSGQRLDKMRELQREGRLLNLALKNYTFAGGNMGETWHASGKHVSEIFKDLKNDFFQNFLDLEFISPRCLNGFIALINKTDHFHLVPQLVDMVDAIGKLEPGFFDGNLYSFGSYDECMRIDTAQYCLSTFNISLNKKPLPIPFMWGVCLPQDCNATDIEFIFKFFPFAKPPVCESRKQPPYNAGAIVMLIVCGILMCLIALGTLTDFIVTIYRDNYDNETLPVTLQSDTMQSNAASSEKSPLLNYRMPKENKKKVSPLDFITAFSLYKTIPTILATKQPPTAITSINGIRVISMFWVILCHIHLWVVVYGGKIDNNLTLLDDIAPRFTFQVIVNGFFSVDSFFFLSGVLVAYLTLRDMARKKGKFSILMYYIHRYLRLTPTLAFVMFFAWFLTLHLADGPIYQKKVGVGSEWYQSCEQYWWTNLLYINNLYPTQSAMGCIAWVWYLANDMQFFIVAPLMIVPLYYNWIVGLVCVGLFLAGSFAATGFSAGYYNIQANSLAFYAYGHIPDPNADSLYNRPYHRIPPYLVGIVLGYLLYRKACLPFSHQFGKILNWVGYIVLWMLATGLCLSTVYGLYPTWHQHIPSLAENVIYLMFSRFVWGIGLALVVFSCHNGYGGVINTFLSMKFWIPLSRLTFTAYLMHPIVLSVVFGSAREPVHYTDIILAVYAVGAVALSYGAAAIVAVCVEFPLANVEAALFKAVGLGARESLRQGTEVAQQRSGAT